MQPVFLLDRLFFKPTLTFRSEGVYRRSLLCSYLALIAATIILAYAIINLVTGRPGLVYELISIILIVSSLLLNRWAHALLAKVILILSSNFILFVFAASQPGETGLNMLFIVLAIGTVTLFDYKEWAISLLLIVVTLFLFYLSYFTDVRLLPPITYSSDAIRLSLLMNFVTSILLCLLFIYFIIGIYYPDATPFFFENGKRYERGEDAQANKLRFELAAKASKAGIYEWNINTDFIYVSPYWLKILGYSDSDLNDFTFKNFQSLVHAEDQPTLKVSVKRHFENKKPYVNEFRIKTKAGYYKWVHDTGTAVFDNTGAPTKIVGSIVDIDERKMAEQQIKLQNQLLEKANEELDRFVYSASHDLRAPLSSLLGLISIAELTNDPQEIEQCLIMMKQRVATMEGFIREITDYSRNSRLTVKSEPVLLLPLLQEVLQNLRFIEGRDRIHFDVQVSPDFTFSTDSSRISIILNNLIANAIKYHDPRKANPFIRVSVERGTDVVKIRVQDNGSGIAEEHQQNIFNMFYRASENSEGSGLGLYIAKECAEKMGGSIAVESTYQQGSTFTINLFG